MAGALLMIAADDLDAGDLVQAAGGDRAVAAGVLAAAPHLRKFHRRIPGGAIRAFFRQHRSPTPWSARYRSSLTSLVAGSVFAKYRFPLRGFLFGLVLATAIVPFESYMIPLYLQLVQVGWINTVQGIVLPYLFMAFGIFLMRQHIASAIPNELMEAARVDGAGEWWLLRHVIAPLSGNALAAVGILRVQSRPGRCCIWPLLVANDQSLFNMELGLTTFQFAFSNDYRQADGGLGGERGADADRVPADAPPHHREHGADGFEGLNPSLPMDKTYTWWIV